VAKFKDKKIFISKFLRLWLYHFSPLLLLDTCVCCGGENAKVYAGALVLNTFVSLEDLCSSLLLLGLFDSGKKEFKLSKDPRFSAAALSTISDKFIMK
jgi:hypothetical protein